MPPFAARILLLLLWPILLTSTTACSARPRSNAAHYDLLLTLDPSAHRMRVQGSVVLPADAAKERQLKLSLSGAAGPVRWTSLNHSVSINAKSESLGGNAEASNPSVRGGKAIWTITGNWAPDAPLRLGFSYELNTRQPSGFLYVGPEIAFGVGNWYPAAASDHVTAEIRINAPPGWVLASSGRPIKSTAKSGRRFSSQVLSQLLFAASPPGSPHVELSPSLGITPLKRRATDAGWREGLAAVQRVLEVEFGPLPYPYITIVEVPDAIADKAGFGAFAAPGAVLARSQLLDQPFNTPAFAHEFTHLWWGNHISLQGSKGDFLLDEGLAQYGSIIAADRILGRASGASYRRRGIPGFNESLYSAQGYLKITAAGFDRPLLALQDDGLSYWIAYSKAGLAWYALAEHMGHADFSAALKQVVQRHGSGSVNWDAFVATLQAHSKVPLEPAIADWFAKAGAPSFAVTWQMGRGEIIGRIRQADDRKITSLEVEARLANGTVERTRVVVPPAGRQFRLPVRGSVREVVLDPDYKILRWTPELRAEAIAMTPYMRASILARTGKREEGEAVLRQWLASDRSNNQYDRLISSHATLARLADERSCSTCAIEEIAAALSLRPQRPANMVTTYIALAQLARRLGRADLARQSAQLAISGDLLVGNANGAVVKVSLR